MTPNIKSVHILSDDFQWLTAKHMAAVDKAAKGADVVLLLVSDSDVHRSIVAPFSFEERSQMIKAAFPDLWDDRRIRVVDVPSQRYSQDASFALQAINQELNDLLSSNEDVQVAIQGYQMELIAEARPQWRLITGGIKDVSEQIRGIDAYLLRQDNLDDPSGLAEFLNSFRETDQFTDLQSECEDKHTIQRMYGVGPFHTADAICSYGDKVLLITRKNHPYRDTLATPGGLIDPDEDPLCASIRELLEETEMRVPSYVLSGDEPSDEDEWVLVTDEFMRTRLRNQEPCQFAGPTRDPRGDYRANAFWFDLSDLPVAPRVLGMDDASKADWISKDDLSTTSMAFDHYAILCRLGVTAYPETIQEARLKQDRSGLAIRPQ